MPQDRTIPQASRVRAVDLLKYLKRLRSFSQNQRSVNLRLSDAEQSQRQTEALLRGLDRRTREIYIAHRNGATYPEIAAYWGISNRVIKRCIVRALLALMAEAPDASKDRTADD